MFPCRIALAFLLATCFLTSAGAQFRQPEPYRILVTNDDGVRAPGIAALAQILQAIGTPIIIAPSENQSGVGHAIVTTDAMVREDVTLANGLTAIGLTATPATTMNVALRSIVTPIPDLVVCRYKPRTQSRAFGVPVGYGGCRARAAAHGVPAIAAPFPPQRQTSCLLPRRC